MGATVISQELGGLSLLHVVSQLLDDYHPTELIRTVINKLVGAGADLCATDKYGETPFTTVICMLEEEERDDGDESEPECILLEAIACYLEFEQQHLDDADAVRVLHQTDRISDKSSDRRAAGEKIIGLLAKRISKSR